MEAGLKETTMKTLADVQTRDGENVLEAVRQVLCKETWIWLFVWTWILWTLPFNITDMFHLVSVWLKQFKNRAQNRTPPPRQTCGNSCLLSLHRVAQHRPLERWPRGHRTRDVASQGRDQSVKARRAWCVRFRAAVGSKRESIDGMTKPGKGSSGGPWCVGLSPRDIYAA